MGSKNPIGTNVLTDLPSKNRDASTDANMQIQMPTGTRGTLGNLGADARILTIVTDITAIPEHVLLFFLYC
jgi:hypothetical protein